MKLHLQNLRRAVVGWCARSRNAKRNRYSRFPDQWHLQASWMQHKALAPAARPGPHTLEPTWLSFKARARASHVLSSRLISWYLMQCRALWRLRAAPTSSKSSKVDDINDSAEPELVETLSREYEVKISTSTLKDSSRTKLDVRFGSGNLSYWVGTGTPPKIRSRWLLEARRICSSCLNWKAVEEVALAGTTN